MATAKPFPIKTIGLWVLRALVALLFLAAAAFKLLGQPRMVQEFGVIGLGQGFRIFTALVEVAGAVLLVIPKTSRLGAAVLFAVCVGALAAQAFRLHGDLIHVIVLMALTGFLAWKGADRGAPFSTAAA